MDILPVWGPEFRVSFELYINSFPNTNSYAEVIRFADTGSNTDLMSYEDRIPAMFVSKDGHINPAHLGCQPVCPTFFSAVSTWYKIDLLQYLKNDQVKAEHCTVQ